MAADMCLPRAVRDLALSLGADPAAPSGAVVLRQTGRMRLRINSRTWLPFEALQRISVTSCAFNWSARFQPLGWLSVTDALERGLGRLDVKALRVLPLVHSRPSAVLTRSERMRYLAELPFAPDAILHNPSLRWCVDAADAFTVSAGEEDEAAMVTLTLGRDGRVAYTFAADRARSITPPYLPTPWRGHFHDYRQVEGRWVPFAGQVGWDIDGVEMPYWHGALTAWTGRAA